MLCLRTVIVGDGYAFLQRAAIMTGTLRQYGAIDYHTKQSNAMRAIDVVRTIGRANTQRHANNQCHANNQPNSQWRAKTGCHADNQAHANN
jgi:hypothetical protein